MKIPFTPAAAAFACLPLHPACAQTPDVAGRTTYQAAYFATFAPSSALDIVRRIPGFVLDGGDTEVRGFSQAAGNVVINGQRTSSKSDTLDVVLARIPASRVLRIEIGSGDLFGSEFAGKPQVVNLVLTAAGGVAGNADISVARSFTGALLPEGTLSVLTKRGASTFNASVGLDNDVRTEEGFDRVTAASDGRLLEYRRKINAIRDPNGYVSASWDYAGGANRTAHLNARASMGRFRLTQSNAVFPAGGTVRDDSLTQRYHQQDYEIGGDVTRPLLGGGIKLIGLATHRDRLNRDVAVNRVKAQLLGGFAQQLDDQRDERVMRLVWNRSDLLGWSVETGAEGVRNVLDSNVDLSSISADGARTRIDLPVDQAVVTEYRGELFANAGREVAAALRLDLGLTYEGSRLTVRGDARSERSLSFLKPKATLDWRPKGGWHAQLAVSRTVAQLQFEDFISAAELTNDRVNGGNADLVPQRAWEVLATVEHPILGDGLAKVELGYNRISLLQDRVPTPEGFDAPGNLGDGRLLLVRGTLDAPLGRLGIKGGRLSASATLNDTSVQDPYTLRHRPFSAKNRTLWNADFRQDLGSFAWGVSASRNSRYPFYRRNEIDESFNSAPYVSAFAEYRHSAKTTLTLGIDNLTDTAGRRERVFFSPDRGTPTASSIEFRERDAHIQPYISLKKNFG